MNTKNIKIDLEKMKPKPPKHPKPSSDREPIEKQIKKRIITQTEKWDNINTMSISSQYEYIKKIHQTNLDDLDENIVKLIKQQINQKIYGYRCQDIEKNKFDIDHFIDFSGVLDLIIKSNNQCYYCKEPTQLLYENVREPKQWTLDRIDNKLGHNKGNLLIACLNCNLRRRTMHTERYVFTKQLNIIKTD
jgi:hypothetical protein